MRTGIYNHGIYRFYNEQRDLIFIEVYYFCSKILAYASICEHVAPFRDITGYGRGTNRKKAIQQAIKDLNQQAYLI